MLNYGAKNWRRDRRIAARIEATIRALRDFSPRWVIPSHCSGLEFEAALIHAFPRGCLVDSVGTQYSWTAPARA